MNEQLRDSVTKNLGALINAPRERRTMKEKVYLVQGLYSRAHGWETLYETTDGTEAYEDLEQYNLAEKDYLHRVVKITRDILENKEDMNVRRTKSKKQND